MKAAAMSFASFTSSLSSLSFVIYQGEERRRRNIRKIYKLWRIDARASSDYSSLREVCTRWRVLVLLLTQRK